MIEHDDLTRIHVHGAVDRPATVDFDTFKAEIERCWLMTNWGYREMEIVPMTNAGWITYITKFAQKPEFDLAIDWTNTRTH